MQPLRWSRAIGDRHPVCAMIEQPHVWKLGLGVITHSGIPIWCMPLRRRPIVRRSRPARRWRGVPEPPRWEVRREKRAFQWKDRPPNPDLDCAAFQLLLDGALYWVRGAQAAAVVLWQGEDGQAFRHVFLQPLGQLRGGAVAGCHQVGQGGFGLGQVGGIPDCAQLGTDAFADDQGYPPQDCR